jgi:PAS domain S-box-containing protein
MEGFVRPDGPAAQWYLAAIVESSDDAIIAKDLNGVVQSCNPAAERLFGYTRQELVGQSVRILIPPDRQYEEDDILERIRGGGKIDHFETVRLTKDRKPIEISLTVSPVKDANGHIVGVSKIARDITVRKRTEAALAAQREWSRVTLASIGDGIIACDPDGRVTYLNPVAEALTGWTSDAASGAALVDVFHIVNENTRERVQNPADLVIRTGRTVGLANHTVLISRHGQERAISDSAAPILDDRNRVLGVVLVFRDFSEQRRAEAALATQREWLQTTLESIGDAVIATDVQGRIVFMNAVAERLTGWGHKRALGMECPAVFHIVNEYTRAVVDNPVTRVLQEGMVVGLANHTILIAADGRERPIDDSGAPIRTPEGDIAGAVLVFRDVTERRRLESERDVASAERERLLVSERAARADAERANHLKDDFVAMVSHELRTPLNAIMGWTELMTRKRGDEETLTRGLDVVMRNTRLQTQLISDLLDVSRIVSGKLRLDFQSLDLAPIVDAAIDTVQPDADRKKVAIVTELDRRTMPVAGDPARLQQIVWNLLSNAIKFTPSGGTIRVGLRRHDGFAEIVVSDNGMGIPPQFLPFVFDRFQQADASRTRRKGGLGLGLSIVKNLVELHDGHVVAESAGEGTGATFTVMLPIGPPASVRGHDLTASSGTEVTGNVSLEGIHVLLVEDDLDTAESVRRLLESHNGRVSLASSAAAALAKLSEEVPDILISDISLPEMDGYALMESIRAKPPAGGPVLAIVLTAYARPEDRTRALLAGYQAHLTKPIEAHDLLATVASFAEIVRAQQNGSD